MKLNPCLAAILATVSAATHADEPPKTAMTPAAATAAADAVAVRCGALVDVRAGRTLGAHVVVVEGARIASVTAGNTTPPGARVVDLSAKTCLPGFIDLHTHLTVRIDARTHAELATLEPADYALRGVANARITLEAGFTTVRNVGDTDDTSIALRNAIEQGLVVGPRIRTAGIALSATGGHLDRSNGMNRAHAGSPGPVDGIVNSVDDAYRAVRERYRRGADLVKVTATGGVMSLAKNGTGPQFRADELEAIVDAAHDYGLKVAAHAHGDEGIARAVAAGVDTIEHGSYASAASIAAMKAKGVTLVPTIGAAVQMIEQARAPNSPYTDVVKRKVEAVAPLAFATLKRAHQAGVRIAFGSDAGVVPHGRNAGEFDALIDSGLTPAEAIRAATLTAAETLGEGDALGVLEAGRYADVIAVDGDPLADPKLLHAVTFVMKDGRVFKNP